MLRQVRAFAMTVGVLAALGVVAGLTWSWVAPRAPYLPTDRGLILADPTTQALIAADGWFAIITGVLGLACGMLAWWRGRETGLAVVLGLAAGGVLASFVTYWVGIRFTVGAATVAAAAPGLDVVGGLDLTTQSVLVSWPFMALGVYAAIEGVLLYRRSPLRQPYGGQPYNGGIARLPE